MRTANTDEGGKKHAHPKSEERKEVLRTANIDGGGQKHTHPKSEETKGLRTEITYGGG